MVKADSQESFNAVKAATATPSKDNKVDKVDDGPVPAVKNVDDVPAPTWP